MAVWADLPPELAISILQELDPTQYAEPDEPWFEKVRDRVDQPLLSYSHVSHQFRTIIDTLLYHRVRIPAWRNEWNDQYSSRTLQQFTRAIVLRPQLAKHVRELYIPGLEFECYEDEEDIYTFANDCSTIYEKDEVDESLSSMSEAACGDLKQILPALASLGLPNGFVLRGGGNGLLLVLLHLLPNLRKLAIAARTELELIAYSSLATFAGGVPAGLNSVTDITLEYDDTKVRYISQIFKSSLQLTGFDSQFGFSPAAVVPFLTLPSVTDVRIVGLLADEDSTVWLQITEEAESLSSVPATLSNDADPPTFLKTPTGYFIPASSSSVKSLTISNSVVSCSLINKILALPISLQRFEHSLGEGNVGCLPFRPMEFLPGLMAQSASLRELVIKMEDRVDQWNDEYFIGSLSGMVALETLNVPVRLLLDMPDKEGKPWDGDENGGSAVSRSPIDNLLPRNLISLSLDLERSKFDSFWKKTGFPKSLLFTRQRLPSLLNFAVKGRKCPVEPSPHEIVHQIPVIQPSMNISLFVSSVITSATHHGNYD
ncbi:hypothetical protein DL93DRAFT_1679760 [Clavulina sp. PMI_390]|nr:hypothetical protein DL93DRAFT_1679760 [Clavulina sp. PMI_390]